MSRLQIIVGSTREGRAADRVTPWVVSRARARDEFDVEVLDLRDWPLPMFQEHQGTIGDRANPTYSTPVVKEWNSKLRTGDAYLAITPEYNHSISGVLKNAFDNVFLSSALRNKPIATVSYSGGLAAGVRAIEHLALIAIEAEMAPLRSSVPIPYVTSAFDDHGSPNDPMTEAALDVLLEDLAWWSKALEQARAQGELPLARARLMAARSRLAPQ
jgi:NAD(P)H-dependent FMN reductase